MRRAKVDRNQPEIVSAFRKCGFTVRHTHTVGQGYPDIHIARNSFSALVEIKDGSLPPSGQKLTPHEQEFFNTWPGPAFIVRSVDDVLRLAEELP